MKTESQPAPSDIPHSALPTPHSVQPAQSDIPHSALPTPHSVQPPQSDIPHSALKSVERSEIPIHRDTPHSVHSSCRLTGKIARLPKKVRDKLNHLLQDGLPYAEIIKRLGPDGKHLNVPNLSRWKDSGYQDWLLERAFVDRIRLAQESAWDLSTDFDATRVTHSALQLATLHIFTALRDLQSGSLDDKLGGDSDAFVRLVNALAHASRQTLAVQSRRDTADGLAGALGGLNLSSLLNPETGEEEEKEENQAQTPPPEPDAHRQRGDPTT